MIIITEPIHQRSTVKEHQGLNRKKAKRLSASGGLRAQPLDPAGGDPHYRLALHARHISTPTIQHLTRAMHVQSKIFLRIFPVSVR